MIEMIVVRTESGETEATVVKDADLDHHITDLRGATTAKQTHTLRVGITELGSVRTDMTMADERNEAGTGIERRGDVTMRDLLDETATSLTIGVEVEVEAIATEAAKETVPHVKTETSLRRRPKEKGGVHLSRRKENPHQTLQTSYLFWGVRGG